MYDDEKNGFKCYVFKTNEMLTFGEIQPLMKKN